jgi:hypothetical protein
MIFALFSTLSQEERVETVQGLVALLGTAASSSSGVVAGSGKKITKSSAKASVSVPEKEKVSRGPSAWTQYVTAVRLETGLKQPEAMAEAKRRRDARDPSCPLPPVEEKKPAAASAATKPKKPKAEVVQVVEDESAGVELEDVEVEDVNYLYLPACQNAAWLKEADGTRGAWAGYLNIETGDFDKSIPAPELEEQAE